MAYCGIGIGVFGLGYLIVRRNERNTEFVFVPHSGKKDKEAPEKYEPTLLTIPENPSPALTSFELNSF